MTSLEDLRQELKDVKKAISAIQNGAQEYRIGGRSLLKPDLSLLYAERDRLEKEIAAAERGGGIFYRGIFEGR